VKTTLLPSPSYCHAYSRAQPQLAFIARVGEAPVARSSISLAMIR
jgi:hypothetical protein